MSLSRQEILAHLAGVELPGGGNVVDADMVRALDVDGDTVRFVLEVPPEQGRALEPVRAQAERVVAALPGVRKVTAVMTAHAPGARQAPSQPPASAAGSGAPAGEPPQLTIGRHATPERQGPRPIPGVRNVIAIASGKGGVGKSTVSSNLAVALARQGRRVGLLDADIYGPSQHRMMGTTEQPRSPDGKMMIPVQAHGVKLISMGLLVDPDQALVWRGPMLMGALQQMLGQVEWGELDALIVDLPPGTGDVQLTLTQRTRLAGAIVVSTPQDVALLDARKAINMFHKTATPVLGLVENMSVYVCPECGHEDHLFGHGGVAAEARKLGVPLLAEIPLALDVRLAGDEGTPVAAGDGPAARAYADLANALVGMGVA